MDTAFLLTIGSFLLTVQLFYLRLTILALLLTVGAFLFTISSFAYSWSSFAYSGKVRLTSALRDCKPRSSTVSKQAPTVSKKGFPQNSLFGSLLSYLRGSPDSHFLATFESLGRTPRGSCNNTRLLEGFLEGSLTASAS